MGITCGSRAVMGRHRRRRLCWLPLVVALRRGAPSCQRSEGVVLACRFHHPPQGGHCYGTGCQPVQSTSATFPENGIRLAGPAASGGTSRQGVHLLDPVRGHDVLPVAPRRFVARDLQWTGLRRRQTGASGHRPAHNKSTLSYANQHRPAALFEDLFYTSLNRFHEQEGLGARKSKFRFKNKLLSLDSTTISLCLDLFPWAQFRRAKGGVKAHVLLDHDDYLPSYVLITEAKRSDVRVAQSLDLNAGSIVAMDRGYNDYELFGKWTDRGVFFVTRLKDNAAYEVVASAEAPLPRNIRADEIIGFTGAQASKNCPHPMRRVVVWDEENQREIVLLTNLPDFGPTTIAAIYKDRWEIELFFKALKQNLKVKTFVGTSRNALLIQIWTALIAILLLKWLHHLSKAQWSFSNLASMLRMNLFTYRNLSRWLENPFGTPPLVPPAEQLTLALG